MEGEGKPFTEISHEILLLIPGISASFLEKIHVQIKQVMFFILHGSLRKSKATCF